MIDIHKLRIFHYVFRLRSFSNAAKELFISQPTVSERIKSLEDEIGVRFFDRLGRQVIPTEAAHILYSYSEKIFSLIEEAKEAVKPEKRRLQGEILIGGSTIPGEHILPDLIARFKKEHPEVNVTLTVEDTSRIIQMLEDSLISMAIVGASLSSKKLAYLPFMKDRLILVAKADFFKEGDISIEDIYRLPFIFRERGSGTRISLEKDLKAHGVSMENIHPVAVLGSSDAVKSGIKAGMGVSFISHLAVKDELTNGSLKEITIKGLHIGRQFYIAIRKGLTLPEACKRFLDFIQSHK